MSLDHAAPWQLDLARSPGGTVDPLNLKLVLAFNAVVPTYVSAWRDWHLLEGDHDSAVSWRTDHQGMLIDYVEFEEAATAAAEDRDRRLIFYGRNVYHAHAPGHGGRVAIFSTYAGVGDWQAYERRRSSNIANPVGRIQPGGGLPFYDNGVSVEERVRINISVLEYVEGLYARYGPWRDRDRVEGAIRPDWRDSYLAPARPEAPQFFDC